MKPYTTIYTEKEYRELLKAVDYSFEQAKTTDQCRFVSNWCHALIEITYVDSYYTLGVFHKIMRNFIATVNRLSTKSN